MNKLQQAGKHLVRGNLGLALKSFSEGWYGAMYDDVGVPGPVLIEPNTFRGNNMPMLFEQDGNGYNYFRYENYSSSVLAYEKCPPVSAIINRKAQAYINGKTWILNSKGKEATGPEANKLKKLLMSPNPLQSWKQFEAQGKVFFDLFGFNIVLPIKPIGFPSNIDATSLWNIPASWIDIQATQEMFTKAGGIGLSQIAFNFNGSRSVINVSDLIIIRDFTPSFSTITFPGSKLHALSLPINNIIGALESRNVMINFRGALGILSSDAGTGMYAPIAMTPQEKDDLQRDFKRYGLRSKQLQVIMTTAALKWQQMGYPTKDLLLMEEVQESTKSLCDGLNFPPHLLGLIDPTFNNQESADKGLYQNCIIPDANNIYDQWSTAFGLYDLNLRLDKDFSHLPVLQDDKVALGEARWRLNQAYAIEWEKGLVTKNQWRVANGEDPVTGDDIYIGDVKLANQPLAVTIGVGGVTGLIALLTAQGMSAEAKQAALEVVFGLSSNDAARMAVETENGQQSNQQNGEAQTANSGTGPAPASQ